VLLLVVLLVALGFGWWACLRERDRREHADIEWTAGVRSLRVRRWMLAVKDETPVKITFCLIRADRERHESLQLLCSRDPDRRETDKARRQHDFGLEFRDAVGIISLEVAQQLESEPRMVANWRLSEGRVPQDGLVTVMRGDGRTRIRLDEWQRMLAVKWIDEREPRDRQMHEAFLYIRVSRRGSDVPGQNELPVNSTLP
jgi:hypothetical protein